MPHPDFATDPPQSEFFPSPLWNWWGHHGNAPVHRTRPFRAWREHSFLKGTRKSRHRGPGFEDIEFCWRLRVEKNVFTRWHGPRKGEGLALVILFSRVQAHFIFKGSGPFQVSTLLGGEIKQMKKWQQQKLGIDHQPCATFRRYSLRSCLRKFRYCEKALMYHQYDHGPVGLYRQFWKYGHTESQRAAVGEGISLGWNRVPTFNSGCKPWESKARERALQTSDFASFSNRPLFLSCTWDVATISFESISIRTHKQGQGWYYGKFGKPETPSATGAHHGVDASGFQLSGLSPCDQRLQRSTRSGGGTGTHHDLQPVWVFLRPKSWAFSFKTMGNLGNHEASFWWSLAGV